MFQHFPQRAGHYLLLISVAAALYLPNLGGPSLWDIDEGNNAQAAREMLEADSWGVPTFNYQLRVDKPALLYWLQILSYRGFGIGEFGARLPSALAGIAAVLLTYELGRRMFGAGAGLLAGLSLASALMFGAAAHFANPDALLTASTTLTLYLFWRGYARTGRVPFAAAGLGTGLAVLAKGPVGLVLPATVVGLYLAWSGQLRRLCDWRCIRGVLTFLLVAAPWYVWVGVETKWAFLTHFLRVHNVNRFLSPMEGHGGPVYYYFIAIVLGFLPWSVFLGPVCWSVYRRDDAEAPAYRFLLGWIGTYFIFFTLARTKLPNYVLPLYPALALLTGQFLDRWRCGQVQVSAGLLRVCLGCFALIGIGTAVGLAVAGGAIPLKALAGRNLPGLEAWAALGVIPPLGAAAAAWCARRDYRGGLIASLAVATVLFLVPLTVWGPPVLDAYKAPRQLAQAMRSRQIEPEVRVAVYEYFQPSLVFYCGREVAFLENESKVQEFLRYPIQVYLVTPAPIWDRLAGTISDPCRLLARHRDLYRGCDVVVVTNRP